MKIATLVMLVIIAVQFSSVKGVGVHDSADPQCLSCHADKIEGEFTHYLETNDDCIFCHESVSTSRGVIMTTASVKNACVACHAEQDVMSETGIHSYMECTNCHSPHASSNKNRYIATETELCGSCHGDHDIGISHPTGKNIEDPNAGGAMSCVSSCHEVHKPAEPKMLQMADLDLCYQCHDEKF